MKKRILSIMLCLVMLVGLIPAAALAEETATTEISSIAAMIAAPDIDKTPAATATLTPADGLVCAQVAWFKLANSEDPNSKTADWIAMNEDETFAIGYYYKVNIFVTKTEGFTFADSVSVSVNEKPCTVTDIAALNAKALTYVFEPLAEPVPAYPTTDSISGLSEKLVAVLCNNVVPAGEKAGEYYGLLDGGFTYASAPTLVNGAYECTINLNPSAYCSQYSTDTGVAHTVNPNTDVSKLTFTVRYNSEKEKWIPCGEISTMGIWVTCDKHVVEYTVSFAANGGSGTMDSKTVEKGTEYTLPACGFTAPSGKVFKAWSVNGTEKSVGDKIVINADTTVTAVWKVRVAPYVPGHTHSYTKVVTEPTCTERGYTTYTCSCGYSYVDDYVNAKGHTEVVDPAVAATCEKTGLTEGKHCSVCNEVLVAQKETPKTEHKFSNGKCSVCGAADPNYVAPVVNPFKDVKEGDAFYDEILWAADKGIIKGDGTGNYNPNDGITRAQIVMILWNAAGNKEASKPSGFADVKEDAWYAKAVAWAVENGITNGTDLGFEPDRVCTRAEIVTFLHRANNKPAPAAAASFTDLTQDWYKDAVAWAVENGITKGVGGNRFAPNDTCTRAQAVTFLHRYMDTPKADQAHGFTDVTNTGAFYYDAVMWAADNGVTLGFADGSFRPGAVCTRGEIVTFIYRAAA